MSLMLEEALEAPDRVAAQLAHDAEALGALAERLRASPPAGAFTIARGSSDHAAAYGAHLLTLATGLPVASLPPSVVTLGGAGLRVSGHLAVAVSQSGRGPDILACVAAARAGGAVTVAVVNDTASPLAGAAEIALGQHAGAEQSVAATKSFLASLVCLARLAAAAGGDAGLAAALAGLPPVLRDAAEAGRAADPAWLGRCEHVYVLARGPGQGIALEAALKLKETCGVHAEAFSSAELRHGPREIVDGRFAVLALALPGPGRDDVVAAARELAAQGARALVVGPAGVGEAPFLPLPAAPDARLAPIVAAQALYPLLARTAAGRGRDPDKPRTLAKVTETF